MSYIYDESGKKQSIDYLLTVPDSNNRWIPTMSNELGSLIEGSDVGVAVNDTMKL